MCSCRTDAQLKQSPPARLCAPLTRAALVAFSLHRILCSRLRRALSHFDHRRRLLQVLQTRSDLLPLCFSTCQAHELHVSYRSDHQTRLFLSLYSRQRQLSRTYCIVWRLQITFSIVSIFVSCCSILQLK